MAATICSVTTCARRTTHPTRALSNLTLIEQPLTDAEDPFPPTVRVTFSLRPSPSTGTPKCSSSCHTRHITAKQMEFSLSITHYPIYPQSHDKRGGKERGIRAQCFRRAAAQPEDWWSSKIMPSTIYRKYQVCFYLFVSSFKRDGSKCACTTACNRRRHIARAKHRTGRTEDNMNLQSGAIVWPFHLA